ncbi:hypothetical protein DSO57_1030948 [Entomophthora muscae]|uniref:Uncharacterized protein n=1 Tax=Entomophthora muscae TaxID=34485 RepID=A0ACC2TBX1_9FUNG|nr:hypothetical protein DSO57_1030948 [Entomophthora muscae]
MDFNQYSVEVICSEPTTPPPSDTPSPPSLVSLLEGYKDVFSKTLEQLPPPREIQHVVQLQGLLLKARLLYYLTPKEDKTLHQHLVDALNKGFIRPSLVTGLFGQVGKRRKHGNF